MNNKRILKLMALNIGIALFNIILFSNAFLHLSLVVGSALSLALAYSSLAASAAVFVMGNYRLLQTPEPLRLAGGMTNIDECLEILEQNLQSRTFGDNLKKITEQIRRFKRKNNTINDILLQKFSKDEMSYTRFHAALSGVENVVLLNVKSIINRISAFDESDYLSMVKHPMPGEKFYKEKMEIYNQYIAFVEDAVHDNEEILLKLDKMLLEVSKYNSLDDGAIENMGAIKEIDELIQNAKWYK